MKQTEISEFKLPFHYISFIVYLFLIYLLIDLFVYLLYERKNGWVTTAVFAISALDGVR